MNLSTNEQNVYLGQLLVIQGHVFGNPRPAIVWQHPSGHTLVDDNINVHTHYDEDGTIQLQVLHEGILIKKMFIFLFKIVSLCIYARCWSL